MKCWSKTRGSGMLTLNLNSCFRFQLKMTLKSECQLETEIVRFWNITMEKCFSSENFNLDQTMFSYESLFILPAPYLFVLLLEDWAFAPSAWMSTMAISTLGAHQRFLIEVQEFGIPAPRLNLGSWNITGQLQILIQGKGSTASDEHWTNRNPFLHTDEGQGPRILLDVLQSSISSSAYKITGLFPKVCFAKPWKGKGRWDSENIRLPLITCYLFNINSLQKNTNKSLTWTLGIHNVSEDISRQMYNYRQSLPFAEITRQSFQWKRGQWEKAVYPKHGVVKFDRKGNCATTVWLLRTHETTAMNVQVCEAQKPPSKSIYGGQSQMQDLRLQVIKAVWKIHSARCWGTLTESTAKEGVTGSSDECDVMMSLLKAKGSYTFRQRSWREK